MYKVEQNKWLTVGDVATYLNLSQEMVYKLVQRGDMPAIRIGSSWRIEQSELERWLILRRMDSRRIKLSRVHSKVIKAFQKQLKKEYGKRYKGLYIFGSVARGEEDRESDLDVLIILSEFSNRWKERKKIISIAYNVTFGQNHPVVLSTILVSEKELMNSCEPLLQRIREEGKVAA